MNDTKSLSSLDSEQGALGAVLLGGNKPFTIIATEIRLRKDDFYRPAHALIWESMERLYDAGGAVDAITVIEDMKRHSTLEEAGGRAEIDALCAGVPAVANAKDYARRVKVLANLRREREAAWKLAEACAREDSHARDEALAVLLEGGDDDVSTTSNPNDLAEMVEAHLALGEVSAMPMPFEALNELVAGGLRRGELTILGAHSSHGKSAFVDQIGETVIEQGGFTVHAYINEMTRLQRAIRMVARKARVNGKNVLRGRLTEDERRRVMAALEQVPFGITDAIGWSAEDIARAIRRKPHDLVIVDLLHEIDYQDEKDLARNTRVLARTAKQANVHIIATAHLNEKRVSSAVRPPPTLGDIRDSGNIKNIADNVLFVWRYQDEESGLPREDGLSWIYFAKARNGEVGSMKANFVPSEIRFEERVQPSYQQVSVAASDLDEDEVWGGDALDTMVNETVDVIKGQMEMTS